MHEKGAQGWCPGMTLRDGMGRWEGVQDGKHMYTHGWFLSVYGKKPLQYCKVISLQLK